MASSRLLLLPLVWCAVAGCSSHRESSKGADRSEDRDAGSDESPRGGRGGAGRGAAGSLAAGRGGNAGVGSAGTGGTAPCAELPNACDEAGASCAGDTLVICAKDDDDCLVETRTNCARGGTSFCDADADPPACAVDPCAAVAGACQTEGRSCNGTTLVRCAKNAAGCLVATRTDCTSMEGKNACGGNPAACTFEPCRDSNGQQKADVCATPNDACAGDYWVHCVPDADGCLIAARTDCREQPDKNFCDAAAEPPSCGYDPCLGVTNCLTAGKTCDGVQLVTCAPNADGCLVETTTDCTQNHTQPLTCDAASGTPMCTTCNDAAGCDGKAEGDTLCDGNTFQRCSDTDGDTCLNAVREDCGERFSCDADPTKRCVWSGGDTCQSELAASLREPMSYGPFDTTGAGDDYSGYQCQGLFFGVQAGSPDLLFALDVAPRTVATLALDSPAGFGGNGPVLALLTSCADGAEESCQATSSTALTYANESNSSTRVYVVVDANRVNNVDNVGAFGLTLDTRPLACGDGKRDGGEACDDANLRSGDGCTPSCTREAGYSCTSSNPSICTRRPEDGICANVRCPDLPSDAPANTQTCCTSEQRCGVAYSLVFGGACLERDQRGRDDESCPDAPSIFPPFIPALAGCCRPDNTCGLLAATGAGCVERTEAWASMADGFGDFLYRGPFESIACTFD